MNLYIIGNGFDLSLGYKTSYYSFLNSENFSRLIQNNSDNELAKFIYSNYNEETNWVDIEVITGKYVNDICNDKPDVFLRQYQEVKIELRNYLSKQETRFDIQQQYETRAFNFLREINNEIRASANVQIINFNYTNNVLGRLNHINGGNLDMSYFKYDHPHGTLSSDIAFGINEAFLNETASEYAFLKKGYSDGYNLSGWSNTFKKVSKLSIFGHSLGITDYDIIKPMFNHFLNNSEINTTITIYDKIGNKEIVTNRIDQLVMGQINSFKLNNKLIINPDET